MADSERSDVHQTITDQFIKAMDEVTGEYRCPWHSRGSHLHLPRNIASGKAYQGINILALWAAGIVKGHESGTVGTYRQWAAAGAQVQKGEKATTIVFYKDLRPGRDANGDTGDSAAPESDAKDGDRPRFVARASPVFFVEQTDAYTPTFNDDPRCESEIIEAGEAYLAGSGARILYGGRSAHYDRRTDTIHLPSRGDFRGTRTSTPVQSFYATAFHEQGHWSGAEPRLARAFGKRFGDDAYAAEELVAELFAAFKCAELGITNELRPDHVQYVRHWLLIMKADNRALFTAAAAASTAVRYVDALQPARPQASQNLVVQSACGSLQRQP